MRKPTVDYSGFKLSKLTDPEYSHFLYLSGWIGYFILYLLTENLIPESSCHIIHSRVDDFIPFCEYFVVFYVFWYALIFISLHHFMLFDTESFKRLQIFIIITQVVAMAVYIIYPNVQYLRPTEFARDNIFTALLGFIYSFDTPTGVCPSLHVAYSMGIASVWLKCKGEKPYVKAFVTIVCIIICISVMFVKQHSFLDVVWAIPLGILAEILTFGKCYWLPKFKKNK